MINIIGRINECKILKKANDSKEAQLVAIWGRRRIGKTYLIDTFFKKNADLYIQIVGKLNGTLAEELQIFQTEIEKSFFNGQRLPEIKSWTEAFRLLIAGIKSNKNVISLNSIALFLDELPWLAGNNSGLLEDLGQAWNSELSKISNLRLIICGSAASWMIKNVVNNKGGLHNRITEKIKLDPFTLKETSDFLAKKHINYSLLDITELYMCIGGVPYYLDKIVMGESVSQAISRLCFSESYFLNEFTNLIQALFGSENKHLEILETLSKKHKGLNRREIIELGKIPNGGGLSKSLEELEQAGFIARINSITEKKAETLYKIIDPFVNFHFRWLKPLQHNYLKKHLDSNYWLLQKRSATYNNWSGYAFENVCFSHILQLKKALGLDLIPCNIGIWNTTGKAKNEKNAQIDLIFDREDGVISLCEIKFTTEKYLLTEEYAKYIEKRKELFKAQIKSPKSFFLVFITPIGLQDNNWKRAYVQNVVTLEDLFSF